MIHRFRHLPSTFSSIDPIETSLAGMQKIHKRSPMLNYTLTPLIRTMLAFWRWSPISRSKDINTEISPFYLRLLVSSLTRESNALRTSLTTNAFLIFRITPNRKTTARRRSKAKANNKEFIYLLYTVQRDWSFQLLFCLSLRMQWW